MKNKDFDFVAGHYRRGAFSAKAGWRRLGIMSPRRWYRRVAAAAAVVAVLGAAATVIYLRNNSSAKPEDMQTQPVESASPATPPRYTVRAIDFDNAPLSVVVADIENVYQIKVSGVPDDADSQTLTLHYEGDADALIAVINEILNTEMTITTQE